MPNIPPSHTEAADFALRALRRSSQPLTVTELEKAIPMSALKSKKELPQLLKQMVNAGQIRSHKARSSVYWLPSLEDQASARIIKALSEAPLTRSDLKSKLRSLLTGWPQPKRDEMLALLVKEKRVYKVSSLTGKIELFSARPELTPRDYVRMALQMVVAKLKPMGFTPEQVFTTAQDLLERELTAEKPSVDLDQTVLERMIHLKLAVANGAPISLTELRHSLPSETSVKPYFDRVVLRLAAEGTIVLHRHDYPDRLSRRERDALVSDERGNYFIGVSKI
ncbi:MAG: hypothetical protein MOB07_15355 [Acidobacteria bacterium]|nr:hypothetical protein [Acidobacteriota bacterium]